MAATQFLYQNNKKIPLCGFLLLALLLLSHLALAQTADNSNFEFTSVKNRVKLSLPQTVYAENISLSPQKIKILEELNIIFIGAEKNKELQKAKMSERFAPSGIIMIMLRDHVGPNQIEAVLKTWIDISCSIYEIKGDKQGLQEVIFGPKDKSKANDVSEMCVPGHPVYMKYSPTTQRLAKIELGAQDCIFFDPINLDSSDCVVDSKIVESLQLNP